MTGTERIFSAHLEFLRTASQAIESAALYAQLALLEMELGLYTATLETLAQFRKHSHDFFYSGFFPSTNIG